MSNQQPFPNEALGDLILKKFGSHKALAKKAHVPILTVERALAGLPISEAHAKQIEVALGQYIYIDIIRKD